MDNIRSIELLEQAEITIADIESILKDKGFKVDEDTFPEETQKRLLDFLNARNTFIRGRKFTLYEVKQLITRAKNATILLGQFLPKREIQEMVTTITRIDEKTIRDLNNLYCDWFELYDASTIYDVNTGENKKISTGLAKTISTIATTIIGEYGVKNRKYINEAMDRLTTAFFIYQQLKPYITEVKVQSNNQKVEVVRTVDNKVLNIIKSDYFKNANLQQAKDIFNALTNAIHTSYEGEDRFATKIDDKDVLSKQEFASLITKTGSIITLSNKEQVEACQQYMQKYREHLIKLAGNDEEFKQYVNDNVTLKNLCLKSGSILVVSTETQKQMYDILTGKSLGDIDKTRVGNKSTSAVSSFKLNCTPYELFYLLVNDTSSSLNHLTSRKMVDIALAFNKTIDMLFPVGSASNARLNKNDFKLSEFATGKNFAQLIENVPKIEGSKDIPNYVENIKTLSRVMRSSEIFKIMQANHMLFMTDSKEIRAKVDAIIKDCGGDLVKLSNDINSFVNENFNEDTKTNSTNASKTTKSKTSKIWKLDEKFKPTPIHVEVDGGVEVVASDVKDNTKKSDKEDINHKNNGEHSHPNVTDNTNNNQNADIMDNSNDNSNVSDIDVLPNETTQTIIKKPTKKVETFKDVLQKSTISDKCINLLKEEVETLKNMLIGIDETGVIKVDKTNDKARSNSVVKDVDIIKVKIQHISKLINKVQDLLTVEESGPVKDFKESYLQNLIKDVKTVYKKAKDKVNEIKKLISREELKRGRKANVMDTEVDELLKSILDMEAVARQSKSQKNRELLLSSMSKLKEENKDQIAEAQRTVNKSRIGDYDLAINYLRQYQTYNAIVNAIESELPELFNETTVGL